PRPRAIDSPMSSAGATSMTYRSPAPPPTIEPTSAAADTVPSTAGTRPCRSRTTRSGNGARSANGKSRENRTNAPNMRAENRAAPRAPPVRGSGLSRTGAVRDSGIGPAPKGGGGTRRPRFASASVRGERQERDVSRPLDRQRERALVRGAGPEHPSRQDLAPLGHEPGEELHVLVVDVVDLVRAELADPPAPEEVALARVLAASAAGPARTTTSATRAAPATSASASAKSASTEAH